MTPTWRWQTSGRSPLDNQSCSPLDTTDCKLFVGLRHRHHNNHRHRCSRRHSGHHDERQSGAYASLMSIAYRQMDSPGERRRRRRRRRRQRESDQIPSRKTETAARSFRRTDNRYSNNQRQTLRHGRKVVHLFNRIGSDQIGFDWSDRIQNAWKRCKLDKGGQTTHFGRSNEVVRAIWRLLATTGATVIAGNTLRYIYLLAANN